jgi:hypothetical protein
LRGSQSLQVLDIQKFHFKSRTDLEVKCSDCTLEPQDAEYTFSEWFRHDQVVMELDQCNIDSSFLSALSGNNSVKRLSFAGTAQFSEDHIHSLA